MISQINNHTCTIRLPGRLDTRVRPSNQSQPDHPQLLSHRDDRSIPVLSNHHIFDTPSLYTHQCACIPKHQQAKSQQGSGPFAGMSAFCALFTCRWPSCMLASRGQIERKVMARV
ncbi:unnamed protein product [Periconia digitata]|uniref:Uncharacterized protein n=1 Tax=Periconia digitata TaxID=1303443 RepID=A0A9W4XXR2_9PLEO|nr:unnamed protein product [Periconia digitata]